MIARLLLAALLGPLVLATSASADCAWVLWFEYDFTLLVGSRDHQHEWTTIMADPVKAKCEAELASKLRQAAKPRGTRAKVETQNNMVFITLYPEPGYGDNPSATETYRYVCLPDTVDPRGAKGR